MKSLVKKFCLFALAFVLLLSCGLSLSITSESAMAENEPTGTFALVDGASIRMSDPTGIRFTTEVGNDYLSSLESLYEGKTYKFGTKLSITDNEVEKFMDIEAKVFEDTASGKKYNTVVTNIPEANFATEITANSYVKVLDGNDVVATFYATNNGVKRSIKEVAIAAAGDFEKGTDEYKLLEKFAGNLTSTIKFVSNNIINATATQLSTYGCTDPNAIVYSKASGVVATPSDAARIKIADYSGEKVEFDVCFMAVNAGSAHLQTYDSDGDNAEYNFTSVTDKATGNELYTSGNSVSGSMEVGKWYHAVITTNTPKDIYLIFWMSFGGDVMLANLSVDGVKGEYVSTAKFVSKNIVNATSAQLTQYGCPASSAVIYSKTSGTSATPCTNAELKVTNYNGTKVEFDVYYIEASSAHLQTYDDMADNDEYNFTKATDIATGENVSFTGNTVYFELNKWYHVEMSTTVVKDIYLIFWGSFGGSVMFANLTVS